MPTYEYACKSCGEHLEVVQSFKDDALTTCPACGGALRKVFGNIGIAFKGSGFYKNDSRSSTKPAAAKSAGAASEASSGSSDSAASSDSPASSDSNAGKPAEAAKPSEGASKPSTTAKPAAAAS
ncbi:MAG: FmdB family zinc ribbon protein [Acidimicrobiales bacterium]